MTWAYKMQVRGFRMGGTAEGRRGVELESRELSLESREIFLNRIEIFSKRPVLIAKLSVDRLQPASLELNCRVQNITVTDDLSEATSSSETEFLYRDRTGTLV
jgi:hypothetical protein